MIKCKFCQTEYTKNAVWHKCYHVYEDDTYLSFSSPFGDSTTISILKKNGARSPLSMEPVILNNSPYYTTSLFYCENTTKTLYMNMINNHSNKIFLDFDLNLLIDNCKSIQDLFNHLKIMVLFS